MRNFAGWWLGWNTPFPIGLETVALWGNFFKPKIFIWIKQVWELSSLPLGGEQESSLRDGSTEGWTQSLWQKKDLNIKNTCGCSKTEVMKL